MNQPKLMFLFTFAIAVIGIRANPAAWAWGNQGHEIITVIAADNLSPAAREQVTRILGAGADTDSVGKAMAAASVRPDTEFREEAGGTILRAIR